MTDKSSFMSASEVVAGAARLCSVSAVAHAQDSAFSVISASKPLLQADYIDASSPVSAALGVSAVGRRVLAVASRLEQEAVREAAAMRLPVVVFSGARPEDVFSLRDAGCLIALCGSHQEMLDTFVAAYRLCEDSRILLPCVVSWNGPLDYSEPLYIPSDKAVKNLLPPIKLPHRLDVKSPSHLDGGNYRHARQQQEKAMEAAARQSKLLDEAWKKKFRRALPAVETYMAEDAELVLLTYGYHSATARAAVDAMRARGKKAGLVRIRLYRPFPAAELLFLGGKKVAVLDFASAPGSCSPLFQETRHIAKLSLGFVSLEKYISERDIALIFDALEKSDREKTFWL